MHWIIHKKSTLIIIHSPKYQIHPTEHLKTSLLWIYCPNFTGLKKVSFHSNPKECSKYCTIALISHASSVQFSRSIVSDSLRPHESQNTRPPCPSPTTRVHPNPCPWSRWCHPPSHPLSSPSPPAPNLSQHQSLFQWVNSSHEVAKVLEFQLQHHSL